MRRLVEGMDRKQSTLFPECLEEHHGCPNVNGGDDGIASAKTPVASKPAKISISHTF
jgi:hypothetical protein